VVDVLMREHRDTTSAEAFFRQAHERSAGLPEEVVSDYHQPYTKGSSTPSLCGIGGAAYTGRHHRRLRARHERVRQVTAAFLQLGRDLRRAH
jgi:transposase-like protein